MQENTFGPGSPPVYCPFNSPAIDPPAESFSRTAAWVKTWGFSNDPASTEIFIHTGLAFTYCLLPGTRPELIDTINCYNVWAFALDDKVEAPRLRDNLPDLTALLSTLVRICDSPSTWTPGSDPFIDAWQDIVLQMRGIATPTQMRRFSDGFQRWMFFYGVEAAHQARNDIPDLSTYLELRAGTTGIQNYISEGEMALNVELPSEERDQYAVRAACEAATLTAALDNDRYSFAKSLRAKEHNVDLFKVLQHADPDMTFEEALAEGVAIRDRCLWAYLRLRDQLLPTASQQLCSLFHVLETCVAGNLSFGAKALRYYASDNTLANLTWTTTPSNLSSAPLDIPSIAWWWDQLEP